MRVQVQDRTIEFLRPNASAKQEDAITPIKQEIKNQDCRKVKVVSQHLKFPMSSAKDRKGEEKTYFTLKDEGESRQNDYILK